MKWKRSAAVAIALAFASPAMAHPGADHDAGPSGIVHVLTEPDHLLAGALLIGAGVAAAIAYLHLRRRRQARRG